MPTTTRAQRARFAAQMAEITEKIGGRIRQLREARKANDPRWTQDYLARQLPGTRTGTEVSRWERGEVKPRDETLEQIADVLDVGVAELYAGPATADPIPPLDALSAPTSAELAAEIRALRSIVLELAAQQTRLLGERASAEAGGAESPSSEAPPARSRG